MQRLRTHGITRDQNLMSHEPDGPWYYEQIELGLNYRMTDMQAALGLSQLERLDDYIIRRRDLAQRYDERLAELPVTTPWQHRDGQSAWHLYVIRLQLEGLKSRIGRFSNHFVNKVSGLICTTFLFTCSPTTERWL